VAARLRLENLSSPLAGPFDLIVEAGTCLAVMGASGAGKSLLLRMIADLDPNAGEVWLGDLARSKMTGPDWRREVVYVAAESGWWDEDVAAHFEPQHQTAAAELADRFGLVGGLLSAKVARLSTGERQRLSLIRALVRNSPALLLDEPTAALDRDSIGKVEAVLRERMAAGTTLIMVTHDPAQSERLGHQHLVVAGGKLTPGKLEVGT
jgi:ABC-type multidrug transport system ATPase subunit